VLVRSRILENRRFNIIIFWAFFGGSAAWYDEIDMSLQSSIPSLPLYSEPKKRRYSVDDSARVAIIELRSRWTTCPQVLIRSELWREERRRKNFISIKDGTHWEPTAWRPEIHHVDEKPTTTSLPLTFVYTIRSGLLNADWVSFYMESRISWMLFSDCPAYLHAIWWSSPLPRRHWIKNKCVRSKGVI